MKKLSVLVAMFATAAIFAAEIEMPQIFADHAVLQRNVPTPVWGTLSKPGVNVTVELNGKSALTISNMDGNFIAWLPAQEAGGPYTLTVTEKESGNVYTASDVYVGEVWLASGQSNMYMRVTHCDGVDVDDPKDAEPMVRIYQAEMITQRGKLNQVPGTWFVCETGAYGDLTGVGYFFARKLARELGVAVGVIHSSWGGTAAEGWISRQGLMSAPEFRNGIINESLTKLNSEAWWSYYDGRFLRDWLIFDHEKVRSVALFGDDPQPGMSNELLDLSGHLAGEGKHVTDVLHDNKGAREGWAAEAFTADWDIVNLPNFWSDLGEKYKTNGVMWFRREIEIPAEAAGKDIVLNLGAIDKVDITYFNGVEIAKTGKVFDSSYWNVPRVYTVPGKLVKAGKNVIAVRNVSHLYGGGLIGPAADMFVSVGEAKLPLDGEWFARLESSVGLREQNVDVPPLMYVWSLLYNSKIEPLIPYALSGVIWYQGESNAGGPEGRYLNLMKLLINDWRYNFQQGDIAFLQVVLAGFEENRDFDEKASWPIIREAQQLAAHATGNLYVSAIDLGDAADIHPRRKIGVGERLAAAALRQVYKRDVVAMGPVFTAAEFADGKAVLSFDNVDGGFVIANGDEVYTMVVAGADKVFHPAQVKISGDKLVVWSDKVSEPKAVRYAWSQNPERANLYNGAGLPMFPFRTDR